MKPLVKNHKKPLLFLNQEKLKSKQTLYASELQKLVGLILLPQHYSSWPDWCVVRKPVLVRSVVLVFCDRISNAGTDDLTFTTMFGQPLIFYDPSAYNYSWDAEIRNIPRLHLSKHALQMTDLQQSVLLPAPKRSWVPPVQPDITVKHRRLEKLSDQICSESSAPDEAARRQQKSRSVPNSTIHPAPFPMPEPGASDAFDRTQLLLNLEQMLYERIPLPPELDKHSKCSIRGDAYVPSKPYYRPVSAASPMFAIDCEMVMTKVGMELARVTMVDELDCVVFDRLVRPEHPVEDYVTRFSGITRDMLAPVTTRVADIQRELGELLPADAILVGHSISNDLHAMKTYHPYIIDTSVIYNLKGARCSKARLRFLAEHFLGRMIQCDRSGHSSAEDAIATMDLVRLKLSQSLAFGDVTTAWRFPENYNAARFKRHTKPDRSFQAKKAQSDPGDARNSTQAPLKLLSDEVHPSFKLKVADLQTSYNTFGPPVDLVDRILHDANVPYACWPLFSPGNESGVTGEAAVDLVNGSNEEQSVGTGTDTQTGCPPHNRMSKQLATWLAELAGTNRFIMARVQCDEAWDDMACQRKFRRFSQKLYQSAPVHSLLVLICCAQPVIPSDVSPTNTKRTVYISLTDARPSKAQNDCSP